MTNEQRARELVGKVYLTYRFSHKKTVAEVLAAFAEVQLGEHMLVCPSCSRQQRSIAWPKIERARAEWRQLRIKEQIAAQGR